MSISIRSLATTEELESAVEMQKIYWGEDMGDLVPHHMLLSFSRYGGHVHGGADTNAFNIAADLIARGRAPVESLVTHQYPLADYRAALRTARAKGPVESVKVVFAF